MTQERTPLKGKPLRNPGQSVRDERVDILFDKLMGPMLVVLMLASGALIEWMRYLFPSKAQPWAFTVIAIVGLVYAARQFRKYWPRVLALQLAEDGEKVVGQFLEALRGQGYQVFHDVVGDDFNVDHVLIGPSGVYTIETKTWNKPRRGSPCISFDGEELLVDGLAPDRNPVIQAKAQAGWMKQLLAASSGKVFPVRPVIVFPGWYIEDTRESRRDLWVLEPKALPAFLDHEKVQLVPEDVKLASFHLSRYIREQERLLEARK